MKDVCKKCGYNSDGLDYCEACEMAHKRAQYKGTSKKSIYSNAVNNYFEKKQSIGDLFKEMDDAWYNEHKL